MKIKNWFVARFKYYKHPAMYGVATYVKSRNGGISQYKRLTGPMSFKDAVLTAEQMQSSR
jgi:hypothetical protein